MGRGVSAGGGQSSLGYLFGNNDAANNSPPPNRAVQAANDTSPSAAPQPIDKQIPAGRRASPTQTIDNKEGPAGVQGYLTNNYQRSEGQNCGNFITERPSTKVHAAPGGGSSLGYLFGGGDSSSAPSPRK
ncbi:spiral1 [Euphorbia peplus]|nr:spiral1 [Euphorbia peplus]